MAKSPALPRLIKRVAAALLVAASVAAPSVAGHVAAAAGSTGRHVAVCAFCWDERR